MAVTLEEVKTRLNVDEPDYREPANMGDAAVPHLKTLAAGPDVALAAKAVYLLSLIPTGESVDALKTAASSPQDRIRVAVAGGARNLDGAQASSILTQLIADSDIGVIKTALRSVQKLRLSGLRPKVKEIAQKHPEFVMREMAKEVLETLPMRH